MRNGAVVEDAAEHVHEHGDDEDQSEYASGPDATGLVRLRVGASICGAGFEEVGAFVGVDADKRDGRGGSRIPIAQERYRGRLPPGLGRAIAFLNRLDFVDVGRC